ncbi:MAG: hypothetical protein R3F61_32350 [Myxococcota bacterium]
MRAWALVFAVGCASPPDLDGGWAGRAVCEDDSVLDTEAILDVHPESGGLDGLFFLDLEVDLGLLGVFETVQRGTIADGSVSETGLAVDGRLERDPTESAGYARNYAFELESDEERLVLEGTLDWINGDGDPIVTCDLELDRITLDD